jgi:hypothetical protein
MSEVERLKSMAGTKAERVEAAALEAERAQELAGSNHRINQCFASSIRTKMVRSAWTN